MGTNPTWPIERSARSNQRGRGSRKSIIKSYVSYESEETSPVGHFEVFTSPGVAKNGRREVLRTRQHPQRLPIWTTLYKTQLVGTQVTGMPIGRAARKTTDEEMVCCGQTAGPLSNSVPSNTLTVPSALPEAICWRPGATMCSVGSYLPFPTR